jgi:TPP-dependent pyruvate/acetoin dehydrogenase alpha subunit
VRRRQDAKFAERDAQSAAQRDQAYQEQTAPPASAAADPLEQLKTLGELKAQGILTEAEFAAQKAKILGS